MANTLDFMIEERFPCPDCDRVFFVKRNLHKHMVIHETRKLKCTYCSKLIQRAINLRFHERTCEQNPCLPSDSSGGTVSVADTGTVATAPNGGFRLFSSCFNRAGVLYLKVFTPNTICWDEIKRLLVKDLKPILEKEVVEKRGIKWYVCLKVVFMKAVEPQIVTIPPAYFNTEPLVGFITTNYDLQLHHTFDTLVHMVDEFVQRGSGWVIKEFVDIEANILKYDPLLACSSTDDDDHDHDK